MSGDDEIRSEAIGELTVRAAGYRLALRRAREVFTPPMLTRVWIDGLVDAGVKASAGKGAWNGRYRPDLPFVVRFACPMWHRTPDGGDVQAVQLVVDDDGRVRPYQVDTCEECDEEGIWRWLLTCPRCEIGDFCPDDGDSLECPVHGEDRSACHHEHEALDLDLWNDDESPFSAVLTRFTRLKSAAEDLWWRDFPEEAEQQTREDLTRWGWSPPVLEMSITDRRRRAQRLREQAAASSSSGEVERSSRDPAPTAEETVDWIDTLRDGDGQPLPNRTGWNAVWKAGEGVPGRPSQAIVQAAVRLRKARDAEPPTAPTRPS